MEMQKNREQCNKGSIEAMKVFILYFYCPTGLLLGLDGDGDRDRLQIRVGGDEAVQTDHNADGTPQHDGKVLLRVRLVQRDHIHQVRDDAQEDHDHGPVQVLTHEDADPEEGAHQQTQCSQNGTPVQEELEQEEGLVGFG